MSEYKVVKLLKDNEPYWAIFSPITKRYVDSKQTTFEAQIIADIYNEETAALRAELDAAKLEIERLREELVDMKESQEIYIGLLYNLCDAAKTMLGAMNDEAIDTDNAIDDLTHYVSNTERTVPDEFKAYLQSRLDITSVTPDDTQKLPELVECPDCGSSGHSLKYGVSGEPYDATCPRCNGTGMVEKLPFAYEESLEQAPTPKFKVGDRVQWLKRKGTISHIFGRGMYGSIWQYKVEWDDEFDSIFASFENEIEHADN